MGWMRRWCVRVLWSFLAGFGACAELPELVPGTCGNGALDPGEDCDTVVDSRLGRSLSCGAPSGLPSDCRYLCGRLDEECPESWACGADGICRYPSGVYGAPRASLISRASQAALGDANGDGRADLILRRAGTVSVFSGRPDGSFSPQSVWTTASHRGDFAVANVDRDGRSDLVVPVASRNFEDAARLGLQSLRGAPGGRFFSDVFACTTVTYPEDGAVFFLPLRSEADTGGQKLVQVRESPSLSGDSSELSIFFREEACQTEEATQAQDGTGLRLAGSLTPPSLGEFARFEAPNGSLGMLALPLEDSVQVITTTTSCGRLDPSPCVLSLAPLAKVSLPTELSGVGGTWLDDLNADGLPDLVVVVRPRALAVALGIEGGGFEPSARIDARFDALGAIPEARGVPRECATRRPPILVARDLNGDNRADFVTPSGVFVSTASGALEATVLRTRGDAWQEAVVGDFNRDGFLDIVASLALLERSCRPADSLDVLTGDGRGGFSLARIEGLTAPSMLRAGDLDGDRIDDLALIEVLSDSASVVALYGGPGSVLAERVRVGTFQNVEQLSLFRDAEGDPLTSDRSVADLVVVWRPDPQTRTRSLSVLTGATNRGFLAPLTLAASSRGLGRAQLSIASGALGAEKTRYDDVWAGTGEELWVILGDPVQDGQPGLRSSNKVVMSKTELPPALADFRLECAHWSIASDDGLVVGLDQFVRDDEPHVSVEPARPPCVAGSEPSQMVVARATVAEGEVNVEAAALVLEEGACPRDVVLTDFDQSGTSDIVLTFTRGAGAVCQEDGVLVYWNPDFAVEDGITRLDIGADNPTEVVSDRGQASTAAAVLNADCTPDVELATYAQTDSNERVGMISWGKLSAERGFISHGSVMDQAFGVGFDVRLLAGDVNGDGLDDLVTVHEREALVHLAVPQDDARAAVRGQPCEP